MKTTHQSLKAIAMLAILTGFLSPVLFAQNDFKLSDYKNPDYKWRRLDLGLTLNEVNKFGKHSMEELSSDKNSSNSYSSSISSRYSSVKNSEFYQGSQNYTLNLSTSGSKSKYTVELPELLESTNKSNSQQVYLNASSENRFYDRKKKFFEADLNISGFSINSGEKDQVDIEAYPFNYRNKSNHFNFSTSIPLLIGKGRIEAVEDARLAVYILEDLEKSGDLKGTASKENILAFSRFITETKNQRFFDSRIRKIAEITAIDSFLTANGLKAQSDASYYTLINDNWDNSNGPSRSAGSRFSFGLEPKYAYSFNETKSSFRDTLSGPVVISSYNNKNNNRDNSWGLDVVAGFVCEKPLNLYWQQTTNLDLGYSLYNSNSLTKHYEKDVQVYEQKNIVSSPSLELMLSHTLGYYPNSRTSISLTAEAGIEQFWGDLKTNEDPELKTLSSLILGGILFRCSYYFSPQLRFFVNANADYTYLKSTQKGSSGSEDNVMKFNNLDSQISAGFTYSIF